MAVGRPIENFLLLYFGTVLADLCEIQVAGVESHANTGHVTKTDFWILKWRTAAISKTVLPSFQMLIIRFRPNLVCGYEFPLRKKVS